MANPNPNLPRASWLCELLGDNLLLVMDQLCLDLIYYWPSLFIFVFASTLVLSMAQELQETQKSASRGQ